MNVRSQLCAAPLLAMLLGGAQPVLAQDIYLARNEKATEQAIASLLISDIYRQAGLSTNIQPLPAARATAMTLAGEKDGEVARVQTYATRNATLVKVEPAFYYLTTTAFAKTGQGIRIASKADLKKYRVGIVRGIAHAEAATEGVASVQVLGDYDQMYRMLNAGRIDVAIDTGTNGAYVLKRLGLAGIQPVADLARLELFHILGPGKKDLAPRIAARIRSLKESGELAKLAQRYEREFLGGGATP